MPELPTAVFVVPCYNEAERLPITRFAEMSASGKATVLFVNDGSTDATEQLLADFCEHHERAEFMTMPQNSGKAEAVRAGLLRALEGGADAVGYLDADLSTSWEEGVRLVDELADENIHVVLGSRVLLLGRDIHRKATRHYLGRVFATAASLTLSLPVYDTQCGAKVFRNHPALAHALAAPFISRWAFDVELIGRLLIGGPGVEPIPESAFLEVPLKQWRDVGGSKLRPSAMVRSALELGLIAADLRARRLRT